jgi:hypothetical protein
MIAPSKCIRFVTQQTIRALVFIFLAFWAVPSGALDL